MTSDYFRLIYCTVTEGLYDHYGHYSTSMNCVFIEKYSSRRITNLNFIFSRFDVSGVHPKSKMPGTYTQIPYCKKLTTPTVRSFTQ